VTRVVDVIFFLRHLQRVFVPAWPFHTGLIFLGKGKALAWSVITNGREPRSCVGQAFDFKLGSFT
jgi:hypothetical protein